MSRMRTIAVLIMTLGYSYCFQGPLAVAADKQSNIVKPYFPPPESQGGWRKLDDPEDIRLLAGMDPDKLIELKRWLMQSDQRNFAAVVIRNGYVVLEVERGNSSKTDARRVASVSKAICATVLAIASKRSRQDKTPHKMSFDDPAFDFIPWAKPLSDPRKAQIMVKQLLNHTSGICPEATGARNDGTWQYIFGHSGDERTAKLAFDPGTACGYSTHALAHAALVCEYVTGKPYDEFAVEALFRPIGCEHWWFQYYNGGEEIGRHPSHGMGMPARDLARIAYCMLRNGKWKDKQVIPKWFVEQTAAPTHDVRTPELRWKLNPRTFSHGWELPTNLTGDNTERRSGEGIPHDARYKPGSGGQLIAFVPSLDLVITRQTGSSGNWQFAEYLRRACAAVIGYQPKAASIKEAKEFVRLFDDRSLQGWQGAMDDWKVEDGQLVYKALVHPERSADLLALKLMSVRQYSDFILLFEFKLQPGTNNGVAIRAPLKGDPAFVGMEIQIIDNDGWPNKLKPFQVHGSIYGVVPAKTGYLKPAGQWNEEEILCKGRRVKVILNGTPIVDANLDEVSPIDGQQHPGLQRNRGFIGLLGHTKSVAFRNIRIKELALDESHRNQ